MGRGHEEKISIRSNDFSSTKRIHMKRGGADNLGSCYQDGLHLSVLRFTRDRRSNGSNQQQSNSANLLVFKSLNTTLIVGKMTKHDK
jgi:hypothetical protein